LHDPTHSELKSSIQSFIKKIINVTRVLPRVEKIFRQRREAKIGGMKKVLELAEKSGGNINEAFRAIGMKPDPTYQNLSEEQKDISWDTFWKLPHPYEIKAEYEEKIYRNKKILAKKADIIEGIEKIHTQIEEDRKHWGASEEVRHLMNTHHVKGMRRILGGSNLDMDPVQKYKESIETLNDVMNDVKNKQP
jgi:hypothetical protein